MIYSLVVVSQHDIYTHDVCMEDQARPGHTRLISMHSTLQERRTIKTQARHQDVAIFLVIASHRDAASRHLYAFARGHCRLRSYNEQAGA
jgi:hypothetical protein